MRDEEDTFDELLTERFSEALDGQVGRATARFREHLRPMPVVHSRVHRSSRLPWLLGVAGSAIAAGVALVLILPGTSPTDVAPRPDHPIKITEAQPAVRLDHAVQSRIYDRGAFLTETGTPMRRVRRVDMHQIRWIDERSGEQMEQLVPTSYDEVYELTTY